MNTFMKRLVAGYVLMFVVGTSLTGLIFLAAAFDPFFVALGAFCTAYAIGMAVVKEDE